ncbi:hypothetical protein [Marinobacter sp. PE14]
MESSKLIDLEYSKQGLVTLLAYSSKPDESPYTHQQIAEWVERFWNRYSDVEAPEEIESIMPILADIETQWDLHLANTYSIEEIRQGDFEAVRLPIQWFEAWANEVESV